MNSCSRRRRFLLPETRIISDIGYYVHDGGHLITQGDHDTMLAFMDAHLARPAAA